MGTLNGHDPINTFVLLGSHAGSIDTRVGQGVTFTTR
jgi:hypothetical protein